MIHSACAIIGCPKLGDGFHCPDHAEPSPALVAAVAALVEGDDEGREERRERVRLALDPKSEPMFGRGELPPYYEQLFEQGRGPSRAW